MCYSIPLHQCYRRQVSVRSGPRSKTTHGVFMVMAAGAVVWATARVAEAMTENAANFMVWYDKRGGRGERG